jgi:hypothetical protein
MKKAYYRRIPIYYNQCTEEVKGRNWFYDILLESMLWIDFNITFRLFDSEGFPIWVEIDDKDQEILGIKKKEETK